MLVCAGYAGYKYATSTFVYRSDATIIIKDPSNTRSSTRLDAYSNLINRTNVSNEILQFRSKRLMTEVVNRLDANINYEYDVKLHRENVDWTGSVFDDCFFANNDFFGWFF